MILSSSLGNLQHPCSWYHFPDQIRTPPRRRTMHLHSWLRQPHFSPIRQCLFPFEPPILPSPFFLFFFGPSLVSRLSSIQNSGYCPGYYLLHTRSLFVTIIHSPRPKSQEITRPLNLPPLSILPILTLPGVSKPPNSPSSACHSFRSPPSPPLSRPVLSGSQGSSANHEGGVDPALIDQRLFLIRPPLPVSVALRSLILSNYYYSWLNYLIFFFFFWAIL